MKPGFPLLVFLLPTTFSFSRIQPIRHDRHMVISRIPPLMAKGASKKKSKPKKGNPPKGFGGPVSALGTKSAKLAGEDRRRALLTRGEKLYDTLEGLGESQVFEDQIIYRDYVVCARAIQRNGSSSGVLRDWIPAAYLAFISRSNEEVDKPLCERIVTSVAKEAWLRLCGSLPSLKGVISAADVEYAVEPLEDFMKYVYTQVDSTSSSTVLPLSNARKLLGLDEDWKSDDIKALKQRHRALVKTCHPDAFPDDPAATERFREVQDAYRLLMDASHQSWTGSDSWFASLGGQERRAFSGALKLGSLTPLNDEDMSLDVEDTMAVAQTIITRRVEFQAATCPFDPDIIQAFAMRSVLSAK